MSEQAFTKTRTDVPPGFFAREAVGLRALAGAGARVPRVHDVGPGHITISRVGDGGHRTTASEEAFGRELARLHGTTARAYGSVDGEPAAYLGDCPIDLTPTESWADSWLTRRVLPLTRRAVDEGRLDASSLVDAARIPPGSLGPPEPPTLLHGDLWAGNRLVDGSGDSWLIDPCAQYGHREVDLAMMQLFGGFSGRVFAAYTQERPLAAGWQDRVVVYQSVPLLVHTLLFGGGYAVQTAEVLRRAADLSPAPGSPAAGR